MQNKVKKTFMLLFFFLISASFVLAEEAKTITLKNLTAIDSPNDSGKSLTLTWSPMENENAKTNYKIEIAEKTEGPWYLVDTVIGGASFKSDMPEVFGFHKDNANFHAYKINNFKAPNEKDPKQTDTKMLVNNKEYFLRVNTEHESVNLGNSGVVSSIAKENYFKYEKMNNFLIMIFLTIVILVFIFIAKRNPDGLFIRRIAGLDAVDEALGRATEMGKPVYFIHGISTMSDVSTIASINILSKISSRVAEFDTTLKVANNDPIVMAVSQETVKESYAKVGRPDAYVKDNIFFAAADQFSYAAAVDGMMVREKPAANFFMGYFYAEALILSETGATTGAIQIAGTDAYTQLPFFITTCDYTLMGEELYAASAYLAREPKLLGSIKGQDFAKALLMALILIGTVLVTFKIEYLANIFKAL